MESKNGIICICLAKMCIVWGHCAHYENLIVQRKIPVSISMDGRVMPRDGNECRREAVRVLHSNSEFKILHENTGI